MHTATETTTETATRTAKRPMPSSAANLFTSTTAQLIAAIEAGAGNWEMPWTTSAAVFPLNPITKQRYRGINVVTLLCAAHDHQYPTGEWATFKQWASTGAHVRAGQRGTQCVWWNITTKPTKNKPTNTNRPDENPINSGKPCTDQHAANHANTPLTDNPDSIPANQRNQRVTARTFTVFNAAQVDNYTAIPPTCDSPQQFLSAPSFFAMLGGTVLHAPHHHPVAELSAAFSCAVLGISPTPRPDHAAYLAHSLDVLRADPTALLTVASKAQAATDYLCAIDGIASPPVETPTASA